jgi:hypothetical protein
MVLTTRARKQCADSMKSKFMKSGIIEQIEVSQKLADEIMVFITAFGLKDQLFYKELTTSNGACFFDSIFQWKSDPTNNYNHFSNINSYHELRLAVVDFVETLEGDDSFYAMKVGCILDYFNLFPGQCHNLSDEEIWSNVLKDMRQSGTWVQDLFVVCTSWMLEINIQILSPDQTKEKPYYTIQCKETPRGTVTLGHLPQRHFQLLYWNAPTRLTPNVISVTCLGCKKAGLKDIRKHLAKKLVLQKFYNMQELIKSSTKKAKIYNTNRMAKSRNIVNSNIITCLGCKRQFIDESKSKLMHLNANPDCQKYYEVSKLKETSREKTKKMRKVVETTRKRKSHPSEHNKQIKLRRLQTINATGTSERVQNFKSSIADGPSFPCCSCKRLLFKNGVKPVTATMKQEMGRELFEKCIVIHNSCNSPINICLTCRCNWLTKKKKVPPLNAFNGLELDEVPRALAQLSDIENVLIAKNILFLKIF